MILADSLFNPKARFMGQQIRGLPQSSVPKLVVIEIGSIHEFKAFEFCTPVCDRMCRKWTPFANEAMRIKMRHTTPLPASWRIVADSM